MRSAPALTTPASAASLPRRLPVSNTPPSLLFLACTSEVHQLYYVSVIAHPGGRFNILLSSSNPPTLPPPLPPLPPLSHMLPMPMIHLLYWGFTRKQPLAVMTTPPSHFPPPIDASTSSLDYKTLLKVKPPPLPLIYLPRSRPAEEALTNILKNMSPPSLQPYKKHLLNCFVQPKKTGVVSRVPGILSGCRSTVDSLVLEDLVRSLPSSPHKLFLDHEPLPSSPTQNAQEPAGGGSSHEPRARRADEALVRDGAQPPLFGVLSPAGLACPGGGKCIRRLLTSSEALRQRHRHFHSLNMRASEFGTRLVDMPERL
ncbi:hypothetical protein EI94DRAFT_1816367 [Lactarius quietus]|nr:hypothetical protein EI94DRAFT_1816367 [Lactarius quietus]